MIISSYHERKNTPMDEINQQIEAFIDTLIEILLIIEREEKEHDE